jgi:flavin reductase ActVB
VAGALVVLECEVYDRHRAGDHVIVVGRVRDVQTSPGDQLVFVDRAFSRLSRDDPR